MLVTLPLLGQNTIQPLYRSKIQAWRLSKTPQRANIAIGADKDELPGLFPGTGQWSSIYITGQDMRIAREDRNLQDGLPCKPHFIASSKLDNFRLHLCTKNACNEIEIKMSLETYGIVQLVTYGIEIISPLLRTLHCF